MKHIKLSKGERPSDAQRKMIKQARKARQTGRGRVWVIT